MGIGLGPQSLNPSSLATYDLLHSLRCEHWNARFGVAGGLQAKLCIFVHSELCCVLPFGGVGLLDPLHSWVCCLGGPDLHKSGVLAAWGGGGGGGGPAGQGLSAAQGCHPHSHSSAIPTPSPTPSQAPGVGVEAPTNAGGRVDQDPTEGHTPLPAYLGLFASSETS